MALLTCTHIRSTKVLNILCAHKLSTSSHRTKELQSSQQAAVPLFGSTAKRFDCGIGISGVCSMFDSSSIFWLKKRTAAWLSDLSCSVGEFAQGPATWPCRAPETGESCAALPLEAHTPVHELRPENKHTSLHSHTHTYAQAHKLRLISQCTS